MKYQFVKVDFQCPRYSPFVRGIHRPPVDSPYKEPVKQDFREKYENLFFANMTPITDHLIATGHLNVLKINKIATENTIVHVC